MTQPSFTMRWSMILGVMAAVPLRLVASDEALGLIPEPVTALARSHADVVKLKFKIAPEIVAGGVDGFEASGSFAASAGPARVIPRNRNPSPLAPDCGVPTGSRPWSRNRAVICAERGAPFSRAVALQPPDCSGKIAPAQGLSGTITVYFHGVSDGLRDGRFSRPLTNESTYHQAAVDSRHSPRR
jgi:hypothetical protein